MNTLFPAQREIALVQSQTDEFFKVDSSSSNELSALNEPILKADKPDKLKKPTQRQI